MRRLALILLALTLSLAIAVGLLVGTERGLRWSVGALAAALPGELALERLEGRLVGPLEVDDLTYRDGELEVTIGHLSFDWSPRALLTARVRVTRLRLESVDVRLPAAAPSDEPTALPDVRLPVQVSIEDARLIGLEVTRPGAAPVGVDRIELAARTRALSVAIEHLRVVRPDAELTIAGTLRPRGDYALDLRTRWEVSAGEAAPRVRGRGRLHGDLAELHLDQSVIEPATAELEGVLRGMLGKTPRWEARAHLGPLDPAEVYPDGPRMRVEAWAQGAGRLDDFRVEARTNVTEPTAGALRAEVELRREPTRWLIDRLQVDRPASGSAVTLHGEIDDAARARIEGEWRALQWPLDGEPDARSPEGSFALDGALDDYRVSVDGELRAEGLPPAHVSARATGDAQSARVETLEVATLDGTLAARGEVSWSPTLRWQARIDARGIDPGRHWDGWDGRLGLASAVEGRLDDADGLHATVDLKRLDGTLREREVSARAGFLLAGRDVEVSDLSLRVGDARLEGHASVSDRWQARWDLDVPDLGAVAPGGTGRLTSSGSVSGARETPRIDARLDAAQARYGEHAIERLEGEAQVDLRRGARGHVRLQADGLNVAGREIVTAALEARGSPAAHEVTLSTELADIELDMDVDGALEGNDWSGAIEAGRLVVPDDGEWRLAGDGRVTGTQIAVDEVCARRDGRHLCVTARMDSASGEWQARASVARLPLAAADRWLPAGLALSGSLDGTAEAHGAADAPARADVRLETRQGELRLSPPQGMPAVVGYERVTLQAALGPEALTGELSADLGDDGSLQGRMRLAEPLAPGPTSEKPLHAELDLELTTLASLGGLMREAEIGSGTARADVTVDGRLAEPRVQGQAAIRDATLEIPTAGITLRALDLSAETRDGAELALRGRATSGDGTVTLEGRARLDAAAGWPVELHVEGERILVMDTSQTRVLVSPDLTLKHTARELHVEGTLRVPEATLRPRAGPGVVRPSEDVEVVGDPAREAAESPWTVTADVRLELGERVRVDASGFEGRIEGALRIREPAEGTTTGQGELVIVDGRYEAYGQKLRIDPGRLRYAGGPIDDPGLDLRAVRQVDEVTAGVHVRGTLKDPRLTLFSEPPMDESDVLSYLLLGRPMSQASGSEGEMLYGAATSLGFTGGELLAQRIGRQFGIEEVRVESVGPTEEASLVLGKHLSPRLYVNYSVGLFEPVNIFRIRYELGRHWTVQTESGTYSGGDLIYTIEYGGPD